LGGQACSTLSTFENLLATQSTREELLGPRLNKFSKSIYWGSRSKAASFTTRKFRREFVKDLAERSAKEKIVELAVKDILYNDDSDEAEVDMEIRYYQQPTYYVKTRKEKQTWKYYRVKGGWLCDGVEVIEDGSMVSPQRAPSLAGSGSNAGSY